MNLKDTSSSINVLVVDDHALFRKGILRELSGIHCIRKIDEAENGLIALEKCREKMYDVIFMDIAMPVMDGISATHYLKKEIPKSQIIIMTMFDNPNQFIELINLGVSGYLLKQSATSEELNRAVDCILNEDQYFTAEVAKVWAEHISALELHETSSKSHYLTPRQIEIIQLLCMQYTANQIAKKLFLSEATVNNHRSQIMLKIGVDNIVGLVIYAIKNGIFLP